MSLVITGLVEALSNRLIHIFPNIALLLIYIFNLLITFGIVTLLFAIIFKVLPDAKIKWKDVITGAMVTAVLFMIGKFGITFYIGSTNVSTAYGTAGSFVILLLWVYYSSIILYFGAEFTKAYATTYGGLIKPNQYAVWVKQIEVEEETGSLKSQERKKKEENEGTDDTIKVK